MPEFLSPLAYLYVVPVLGFMILIHEFGHYAVAKLLGVRVEVFSIGFGKRLIGFRRGDTDYRIAALPLGGYVKMSGENPMDARTDDPGEFMNHPRWHRFLIAIAGPTMNILLAACIYNRYYERLRARAQEQGIEHIVTFGAHAEAGCRLVDYRPEESGSRVEAVIHGTPIVYRLGALGRHWAITSLAALAAIVTARRIWRTPRRRSRISRSPKAAEI